MPAQIWGWKMLDGKTQQFGHEPFAFWNNPTPLPYYRKHITESQLHLATPEQKKNPIDVHLLAPEKFPLLEDFEVIIWAILQEQEQQEKDLVYDVQFFSPSRGFLGNPISSNIHISEYVPSRLCQEDFVIPCGSFTTPYYDFGQSFVLLIAEQDGLVYIGSGNSNDIHKQGFDRWFKVERNRYFLQWEQAIQLCRRH